MASETVKRLYVLDYGLFEVQENGRIIGIQGFLIQGHDGTNILVDTGFPAKYADNAEQAMLEDDLGSFGRILELSHENLPTAQLKKTGLKTENIDYLVMTHTDIDHVGGIAEFAQAPMIIGRAERELDQPRYHGNNSPIDWPANVNYQLVDEDTMLIPGVILLSTPGHSPGHLSLLISLPETGAVILAGDAISRQTELGEGLAVNSWDKDMARASAEKLVTIAEQEEAMLIYGHDPQQWKTLRKAPAFYA